MPLVRRERLDSGKLGIALAAGAAALAAWLLWYPMRDAAPFLDDYVFFALGVHVDTPLALLLSDAMGSFFFRPFVMFLWALSAKAFGVDAPIQYALNIGLHAANGLLLLVLARRYGIRAAPAAVGAILFVVHPTPFAAAAWLSDRFDVVALFCGLCALIALEAYWRHPRRLNLAGALCALLLALLSKEIAYAIVPVALASAAWRWRSQRGRALRSMIAIAACAAATLCVRALVVRPVAAAMFLDGGTLSALWDGCAKFFHYLPAFLVVRHGGAAALGAQALLVAVPLVLVAGGSRFDARAALRAVPLASAAIILLIGCAAAQAPVMHASPIQPFDPGPFQFIALAGSRFYYVAFAGLALLVAACGHALIAAPPRPPFTLAVAALLAAVTAGMTAQSRDIAREWSSFVRTEDAPLVQAAVAAVRSQQDAPPGCKIFLLDLPDPDDTLRSMLDVAVKQALPPGDPRAACFIQSEHTPWYHLLEARGLPPGAERPLSMMVFAGKPYLPLRVGNLEYFYLTAVDAPAIVASRESTFYAWDGARFANVTELVRSGRRHVAFYDNRPRF